MTTITVCCVHKVRELCLDICLHGLVRIRGIAVYRGSELRYITSSSLVVFQVVQDRQEGLSQGKDYRGERREESVNCGIAAQ